MTEEQKKQAALYQFAKGLYESRVSRGIEPHEIVALLMKRGLDSKSATGMVTRLAQVLKEKKRKEAFALMGTGGAVFMIGVVLSVLSYEMANMRFGFFVVKIGMVVVGLSTFCKGLFVLLEKV